MEAATKWQRELSADEIAHFSGIVERVLPPESRERALGSSQPS